MSLSAKLTKNHFSRENIIEDYPLPPFILKGFKRLFYLFLYLILVTLAISGLIYSFYLNPLFCVTAFILCYLADNFLFAIMHLRLHAQFIEIPENKMNVIEHLSFIHHYRNTKVYHEHWLESRIAYFIDPRSLASNRHVFFYKISFNMVTSCLLYTIHPLIGITYFSGILGTNLMQSAIHEWYHNPPKNRKKFYNPLAYCFLTFLEKIKLASSKRHLRHHLHNLSSLDKAEAWLDLYTPAGEVLTRTMWKRILAKYIPGKYNMTNYMTKIYEYALVLVQILLPLLFLGCFWAFH